EGGVFGVLPGTIGTLQATEALKVLLDIGDPMIGTLILYDALEMRFDQVRLKKNPNCKVCSADPEITALIDYEAFCGVPGHDYEEGRLPSEWEISATELSALIHSKDPIRIIDVREPHELQISNLPGSELIPLGTLAARMHELDSVEPLVLICKSGTRSARALEILAGAGFRKLKNLRGGINAWANEVDPSLPIY
ncbi:MAG: molybdenum cofactor biosynthesis protein MoeB, partial [Anaerolineales bacterium]|nr:molybdenum cofactor biosynthesis protein MoeB [Anaerolineales bacterium]